VDVALCKTYVNCVYPIWYGALPSIDTSVYVPYKHILGLKIVFDRYRVFLFVILISTLGHL